ncbi:MAG: SPOR domain-containing protein [Steroidobacteraceae bacterium]
MWICAACAAAACSRQEAGWEDAVRENSIAAYQHYLEEFPAGLHAADAQAKLLELREEEDWARANRLRTPEAWQRYLGDWPKGRHAPLARRQLVEFIPRSAPVAPPASASPASEGGFAVQLGAYSSEPAARANQARLASEHAGALTGLQLLILAPHDLETDVWRIRTSPLAEDAARDLCERLRGRGVDCVPVTEPSAGQAPP